jgi:hypothetical protein
MAGMNGFFLSIDALTALAIVLVTLALVTSVPQYANQEAHATIVLAYHTHDDAVLGLYARQNPTAVTIGTNRFAVCSKQILPKTGTTNLENTAINSVPDIEGFEYCEVHA